ncbi:MAG: hemerythrin domain-containing protein [Proteobacteria bacterium]|nr:hemerythrin domain-containing protein [Pseudomonadota bacterium]
MTQPLFAAAPGFDQPLAVLKHCHDRIRKQLATLKKLQAHLPAAGADLEAQQAAHAILRYFNDAAPLHHADEEDDLLPQLEASAQGEDAQTLATLLPLILREHREMETLWRALDAQLAAIATGRAAALSEEDAGRFAMLYDAHMQREETQIAPMAMRLFSAEHMTRLGDAMRARRGLATS